jgi:hypothetical protein
MQMQFHSHYSWYHPYPSTQPKLINHRQGNQGQMMMPDQPMDMMEAMRNHMMVTNEIKETVDRIEQRIKRIEGKMMR